jgi:ferredoxin-NADP reductase
MKVNVRGHLFDLLAFSGLSKQRKKHIEKAPAQPVPVHPVNVLVQQVHPDRLHLVVTAVQEETRTSKTFRLVPEPGSATMTLPPFRAGQYLSLRVGVGGVRITRPYSISSAPYQALGDKGFYEVTVKRVADGFLSPYLLDQWKVGTRVESSAPAGFFYHEPLRDAHKIAGLAGGSGITPFRAMAREIVHGGLDAELLLLYGSSDERDILFYDELKALEAQSAGKVRVVHVLSCAEVSLAGCEQGFITADILRKYADVDGSRSSFFVCGPQVMYHFVEGELAKLELPRRRVRWEAFGEVKDIAHYPGFPAEAAGKAFALKVHINGTHAEIPARATETVLVAMERANRAPPAQCRSGECGFCRSLLLAGDVFVVPESDGRRAADREFGHFHPCSSYPLSDLEVKVPQTA